QLRLFRSGVRGNPVMQPLATTLSDQDIDDLAVYYEAQTPAGLEADPSYWRDGQAVYVRGDRTREVPACIACHGPVGRGNLAAGYPAPRAPPPPVAPAPAAAANTRSPAPPQTGALPAPADAAQSESQQATASQESVETEGERPARSDTSLERIAELPAAAQLPDGKWQPGVSYQPLVPAQPTSVAAGKVEVIEVFWLACPHCYALEPFIRNWLKTKPAYVEFVRVPVMWGPVHRAHARFYYTLAALGRDDLV